MIATEFRCRDDFVLFRLVKRNVVTGLHLPDQSQQANDRVVVAVGPKVEGLQVGDKVWVIGTVGVDTLQIPTEPHLYATRAANVALVEVV